MTKYFSPETVEELKKELERAIEDFEFLQVCKKAGGQPYGDYLNPLLVEALSHLADKCEEFTRKLDEYIEEE